MKEKIIAEGKMFQLVHTPHVLGGKTVYFEHARRAPGVRLIIPSADRSEILITSEYRREVNGYDLRLPGGKVFDTLKEFTASLANGSNLTEHVLAKARAEAREETGVIVNSVSVFGRSVAGSSVEWDLYFCLVDSFYRIEEQCLELGEDIKVCWMPLRDAALQALSGGFSEDRSAAILLRWAFHQGAIS